jgi:hypothetical protein
MNSTDPIIAALGFLLILTSAVLADDTDKKSRERSSKQLAPTASTRKDAAKANGCGAYAERAPEFSLKDPLGKEHCGRKLYSETGMVIMLTVPNLTQFEKQKRWEKWLRKQAWPAQHAPRCVVLEDLSQQQSFKEKVRQMMVEKCKVEEKLVVLVDEDGAVRRQFQVNNNETVILVVDPDGNVIHHERDDTEPDAAAARRVVDQAHTLSAQTETRVSALKTAAAPQQAMILSSPAKF